jgi:hypothetical protein
MVVEVEGVFSRAMDVDMHGQLYYTDNPKE